MTPPMTTWQCPRCGFVTDEPAFITEVQHPCRRNAKGETLPAGRVKPVGLKRAGA